MPYHNVTMKCKLLIYNLFHYEKDIVMLSICIKYYVAHPIHMPSKAILVIGFNFLLQQKII